MPRISLLPLVFFTCIVGLQSQNTFIKDNQIFVANQKFIPIVLNYQVDIRFLNEDYWVTPSMAYFTTPKGYNCQNKQDCLTKMSSHFAEIKSMGFNSIRLCGAIEYGIKEIDGIKSKTPSTLAASEYWAPLKFLEFKKPFTEQFQFIEDVLTIAKNNDLKVILLVGGKEIDDNKWQDSYSSYLQEISKRFQNNTTLIAYDLLNEPAYYHNGHTKEAVCLMVQKWVKSIKDNTSNQLVTIGLTNSETTFEWDAAVLNVDFISFHPYPAKGNSDVLTGYANEIYWISNVVTKPWIIGETGYSATQFNNAKKNHGNLQQQLDFAQRSAKYCFDCGGVGYSWWQYHDVHWETDYGVIDSFHVMKPVAGAFNSLVNYIPDKTNCYLPKNFYNPTLFNKYQFTGKVVDDNCEPIKNAIIRARSIGKGVGITYSKSDGTFVVYNNNLITKLEVTAYGYESTIRYRPLPNSKNIKLKLSGCCDWSFRGFLDANDISLIADANGDGKDDLVLFNTGGSGTALRVIDLTTMSDIKSISYSTLGGGWNEPNDRALIADANGDGKDDLLLFNTGGSGTALRVVDLTTMNDIKSMPYSTLGGGWNESNDRTLIADANGDGKDDLLLFNTGGNGIALRVIDLTTMNDIKSMPYSTLGGGWNESNDRALIADANGDGKDDLLLFNTGGSGTALRVIDLTTMNDIKSMPYSTLGGGWNEDGDRALIADANGDGKDDLLLFNTDGNGTALRVIDLTTMNDIKSMPYSTLGGGWNESNDRTLIADANGDGKDDLLFFNTGGNGIALRVIDLTTMKDIKSMPYSTLGGGWNESNDRALIANVSQDSKFELVMINSGYIGMAIQVKDLTTMANINTIMHCEK